MRAFVACAALLVVLAFLLVAMAHLHPLGEPSQSGMDDYFIKNAQEEIGINNVVTAVVFDYRGFDTLGEATVLFTAVTSVLMVFWRRGE